MLTPDALDILTKTIEKNIQHRDYKRVTGLAKDYQMYMTGKGIDVKLRQFKPRENDEMFKQRCALTIPITPAVYSSLMKPFNKVARTKPIVDKVTPKTKSANKNVGEVMDAIKNFFGAETSDTGLDYFLKNRFNELTFWDPNAWIVVEFDDFDPKKEKAKPRPFEVSSEKAVMFSIKNNMTEYLVVKDEVEKQDAKDTTKVHKVGHWTMYTDQDAIVFTELYENEPVDEGSDVKTIGDKKYLVTVGNHKAGKVPAIRVGYKRDTETDGRTFVSPLHDANCYMEKIIKQGSEYDLSTCLHVFPQKIVRIPNGIFNPKKRLPDGSKAQVEAPVHTTGQDVIEIEVPESKEEYVPLSDFVYYVPLPVELLKLQKEWVDDLEIKCNQAVFNSTVMVKKTSTGDGGGDAAPATATEKDQDMDSVYDTIFPYSEKLSSAWTQFVMFIAIFTDNDQKVTWFRRYPSNFKMKTKDMLYAEMSTANEANLPSFVKEAITDEIAELVFVDDPRGLIRYRIQKQHFPFNGKSETEIQIAINSPMILKRTKVLYNYFYQIFDELEAEYSKSDSKDFYVDTTKEIRDEQIKKKVDALMKEIEGEQPKAINYNPGS